MTLDYEEALFTGRYKEAEERVSQLLEGSHELTREELAVLYNDRGQARYQQVKFWEAKEDYQQALLLNPAVGAFHYNLSTILYRMGEYRSALAGFEKAVAIAPSNPEFVEALTACQQRVQLE